MSIQGIQSMQEKSASDDAPRATQQPVIEVGAYGDHLYRDIQATFVVQKEPLRRSVRRKLASPVGVLFFSLLVMVAIVSLSLGAALTAGHTTSAPGNANASTSSSTMTTTGQTAPSNIPNATQKYGGQPATYVLDPDGAKHFTFTAKQVMWEVIKGHRELAWTIDGTVPGPTIHVTVGDHLRITVANHFPQPTALHWHGLKAPSSEDGVPGVGVQPIQPGQSYTYDFTITPNDIGTHWYHSHYDDLE